MIVSLPLTLPEQRKGEGCEFVMDDARLKHTKVSLETFLLPNQNRIYRCWAQGPDGRRHFKRKSMFVLNQINLVLCVTDYSNTDMVCRI
ncbi:hypothetical protein CEXT_484751 [Caerostris extrusa]|uniref:Uncharacterized protein n=1 Tax=Caerostris extrusa TaxID=172846 RepID=A0AAV4QHT9_CAEEX|nr:hypothetical protein CEXT_484751 [Caerostris extrusa]